MTVMAGNLHKSLPSASIAARKVIDKELVFCFSEPNVRLQRALGFGGTKVVLGKDDRMIPKMGIAMPKSMNALHLCHLDTKSMVTIALEIKNGAKKDVMYITSIY